MRCFLTLPAIIGASVYVSTPAYSVPVLDKGDVPSITDVNAAPGPKLPDQDIPSVSTITRKDDDHRHTDEPFDFEPLCEVHVDHGAPSLTCRIDNPANTTTGPDNLSADNTKRGEDHQAVGETATLTDFAIVLSSSNKASLSQVDVIEARMRKAFEEVMSKEPGLEPGNELRSKVSQQYKTNLALEIASTGSKNMRHGIRDVPELTMPDDAGDDMES